MRWVYWEPETKLLDEKREDLFSVFRRGTIFMTTRQKAERDREGSPFLVTRHLPDYHLTRPGSVLVPMRNPDVPVTGGLGFSGTASTANLSPAARAYLASLGVADPDTDMETAGLIWMHALAIGYSPAYLGENADGIRRDWPRIPLPDSKEALLTSAELGKKIATLLDTESDVAGVTSGDIRRELRKIAVISRDGGGALDPAAGELAVKAGWGHAGKGGVTMPGSGKLVKRPYLPEEAAAITARAEPLGLSREEAQARLGESTRDVYLNDVAYWRNVPEKVWGYTIGGYQVMKKWLSYREADLLGRALAPDEVREVTNMARRIAAILLLEPVLDENYQKIKTNAFPWADALPK